MSDDEHHHHHHHHHGNDENYRTLTVGHTSTDVSLLRDYLGSNGYMASGTDVYDEALRDVVMDFQRDKGLHADGVCGDLTWKALGADVQRTGEVHEF